MATRIKQPVSIRSATHYPQFQETNVTLPPLPSDKFFGVTKWLSGISMNSLLTKVSGVQVLYPENANGAVDRNKTWLTGTISRQNAVRTPASINVNETIGNGQTIVREYNNSAIIADDFLGENNSASNPSSANGLTVNRSKSVGKVTWSITNNTGSDKSVNGTFTVNVFKRISEIAANLYNEVRKGTVVFGEWNENGMPHNKCEELLQALFNLVKANDSSVVNPQDTNIFCDYFANNNGFGTDIGTLSLSESLLKQGLSNQSFARSFWNINLNGGAGGWETSYYWTQNAANYRNRLVGGYIDGIRLTYDGNYIYNTIYNLEKAFIAQNNRKTGVFGWGAYEGVGRAIESEGSWDRLPFTNPSGDLIRLGGIAGSYGMMEAQAFFSLFLGNTYVMWHDGGRIGTDINCFNTSQFNQNQWQPTGGAITNYNPDSPTSGQPIRVCSSGQARWNAVMESYHNGAFAGAYIYASIADRSNTSIKYANFSYNDRGTTKNGYVSGNTPVLGALGNAAVSRYNISNAGQHNVVDALLNKKPIVMYGTGSAGDVFVIYNPYASILGVTTYTINEGTPITIEHNGTGLGVYIRDSGTVTPTNTLEISGYFSN